MKRGVNFKCLTGALFAVLFAQSAHASVVYQVNFGNSAASAVGTITTDGATGVLGYLDITAFDLTLTQGSKTAEIASTTPHVGEVLDEVGGGNLTATSTGLYFNFAGANSGFFYLTDHLSTVHSYFCLNAAGGLCDGHPSSVSIAVDVNGTGGTSVAETGNFQFATVAPAVPEPSTWAMMILGFAGIGAMTYRRRKTVMLAA
jgi:hypothetical protein